MQHQPRRNGWSDKQKLPILKQIRAFVIPNICAIFPLLAGTRANNGFGLLRPAKRRSNPETSQTKHI